MATVVVGINGRTRQNQNLSLGEKKLVDLQDTSCWRALARMITELYGSF